MSKIKKILEFAMRMEKDAEEFYNYYADVAKSDSTKKLFHELAAIEVEHYKILKRQYDKLGFESPPQSISWVVDDTSKSIDPSILSINSSNTGNSSDLSIIRMAYLIEGDFEHFYSRAVDYVDNENEKNFLKEIAKWESEHKKLFEVKYKEQLELYWEDISKIVF